MNAEKERLRKTMLRKRNALTAEEVERKSDGIVRLLGMLPECENAGVLMAYWAMEKEVQTRRLISVARQQGRVIVLPKMSGSMMEAAAYESAGKMEEGAYGIMEPAGTRGIIPEKIDAVLVPGLAFDTNGNRVGFGRGHYDVFLKRTRAARIGVAFDFQLSEAVPCGENDEAMDVVVTEKRVVRRAR